MWEDALSCEFTLSVCVCVSPQNWQEVVNKADGHIAHSVASVKVTSDISAQCNVSNDMGTEVKVFSIKASKSLSLPLAHSLSGQSVRVDHAVDWMERVLK